MARYKPYDRKQDKFIAVSYTDQIVAGLFEHALNEIVEQHLDLGGVRGSLPQRSDGAVGPVCARYAMVAATGGATRLNATNPGHPPPLSVLLHQLRLQRAAACSRGEREQDLQILA